MTPRELLNDVLTRFQVVYLSEAVQESLLKQALATYQRIAGPVARFSVALADTPSDKPDDFSAIATCVDSQGRWHEVEEAADTLTVLSTGKSSAPFVIHYFQNLRGIDTETGTLPEECISLVSEYLYTIMAIPNTQRAREAMTITGIQMELPADSELNSRKELLEQEMDEAVAIIPMATVY